MKELIISKKYTLKMFIHDSHRVNNAVLDCMNEMNNA